MNNFTYDIELFNKNCGNIRSCDYQKMNKTQLIASLTIDYHRIEKGLAMQNTSPNFGVNSGVLKRLYDMNKVYISKLILYIVKAGSGWRFEKKKIIFKKCYL